MNKSKVGALKYIGVLAVQRLLGAALFFVSAGTVRVMRGWIYFWVYILMSAVICIILYRSSAEMMDKRRKVQEGTKRWDKVLLFFYVLLAYFGIYAGAGLGFRFGTIQPPDWLYWTGITILALSTVLGVWPLLENRHFESSVRIQEDRGHRVCTTGPYAYVRHPGYSAIILWSLSMPMIFGSPVWIISVMMILVVVLRTYLEDRTLTKELPGYTEYREKVRYRLIPLIW